MLIPSMLQRSVERSPEADALVDVDSGRRYSYRTLSGEVNSLAHALVDFGVERGDRVTLLLKNHPRHVVANLAVQVAGGAAVPFNFRSSKGSIEYHVEDSDPSVVFFDDANRDAVADLHDDLSCDEFVYVGDDSPAFAHEFDELLDAPADPPDVDLSPDDLSVILYTSGTTGRPKGIPIDHRNSVLRAVDTSTAQGSYLGMDTTLSVMPLYHTIGLHSNCLARLCMSGTFVPMPEFDPEQYVELIEEEGATVLFTAPTILNQLMNTDAIETADVSSVRVLGYGGEAIGERLHEAVRDRFDADRMINIYGNTESYHPLELVHPIHSGRNGLFYRTRIVELNANDPTATVDPGNEGELIIDTDGPITFDEYWGNPEETATAIHDGWFFTGDAAYETDDGLTVITGRADDTIISGGENVHPAEVEDVLRSHSAVADVGVVGVPDEEWGEVVKAFVQPDGDVTGEELDEWCRESDDLDDFKRPRAYEFVEEIPRNPSGKVMRYKLRDEE